MGFLKGVWAAIQDTRTSSFTKDVSPNELESSDELYRYKPLPSGQIRVIVLQSGALEDQLRCRLESRRPSSRKPYEALSYCWGEGEKSETVLCGTKQILITKNLWLALKRLRRRSESRVLYVDQICINQQDLDERAAQVSLMGEIYSRTEETLIWLGEEDDQTELAFSFMEKLDAWLFGQKDFNRLVRSTPEDAPEWMALRSLIDRPWFSRSWVFQELVLAQQAQIVCGPYTVSAQKFGAICSMVTLAGSDIASLPEPKIFNHLHNTDRLLSLRIWLLRIHEHPDEWQRRANEKHLNLLTLLKATRSREATVPSDKIFALLGVANDAGPIQLHPDYKVHFREVYATAMRSLIGHHRNLLALRLTEVVSGRLSDPLSCRELPSWVPDFRCNDTANLLFPISSEFTNLGQTFFYNTSGNSAVEIAAVKSSLELSLHGLCMGRIEQISEPSETLTEEDYVGKTLQRGGSWFKFANSYSSANRKLYAPTSEPLETAFIRTCVCDWFDGEHSLQDRPNRIENDRAMDAIISDGWWKRNRDGLVYSTSRRRLFFSDNGYMGICHQSCTVGDELWILMGGDMPCTLRRLHSGKYEYKGEAYVHGVMDGEFLLQKGGLDHRRPLGEEQQAWLTKLGSEPHPFATEIVTLI
ncbi:MAG: hypothetical protein Q9160_005636 [Pyrenula sp. 1 TL-2023]